MEQAVWMSQAELKAVVRVLKARFNNLGAEELIDLAAQIVEAMAQTKTPMVSK